MPTRILILSAAVGAGHMRAASAVEMAVQQIDPSVIVRNVDVLTLTNSAFRRVYGKSYLDMVNKAPHVLGYFYDLLDKPKMRPRQAAIRLLVEKLNLRAFYKLLASEPWDCIVNTHFLPGELVANLRRRGKIHLPQITVTTDFEVHRLWVNQPCDLYCTATDEGKAYITALGVPADSIRVTGIPIDPIFSIETDRSALLRKYGLHGDRPVILQLAGGFGVGPVEKLFTSILSLQRPVELIMVSGKNEALRRRLAHLKTPSRHRVKVIGYTTEIDELMSIADVVVSKPGGLTTSEVLARGAAMAIVNPIPGQESRNSDYLLENGAAIKINNVATVTYKLEQLLCNPQQLATLKARAKAIGRPHAAFDIAREALTRANRHLRPAGRIAQAEFSA